MTSGSYCPRPEYPRPDRQRGRVEGVDWLNLNGPWQFRFDRGGEGESDAWWAPESSGWGSQIIVPFCWESLAAWGEGDMADNDNYFSVRCYRNPLEVTRVNHRSQKRYEIGWYRREIVIPATSVWRDKRIILTIGAADYYTDCWCNGVSLGHHEGGYLPFEFDLTDSVGAPDDSGFRRAIVVLRVEDPMDNHEQPVGKQWGWYTTTSGIWQTVYLEPRSASHIHCFRIHPDIDHGRVAFEVECKGTSDDFTFTVEIIPPAAPSFTISLDLHDEIALGDAEIHPVLLWEPGDPKLYRVVLRLWDAHGQVGDIVRSYFGMRKIGTAPADDAPAMLCLNNKPIYLRGALYQSYFPEGVYTAMEARTLRNDITYAIEMGFDFLRIHLKLDDPLLLYYADTLGMLLMQDFPNFGEGGDTEDGRRRFEEMMIEGIKRDYNHPSIISWCIFNETWGFGGQNELMKVITPDLRPSKLQEEGEILANSSSFQWVHKMWNLAKEADRTRLVEDMSVVLWEHLVAWGHVDTDINSWHFYIKDYYKARDHIEEVVAKTYHGSAFNYVEGFVQRNVPLINSEYGGVGALDPDQDISWSFKFLTNELRRHGQLSAYIFTQLMDVEWECNGFMNYDRSPKEFGFDPSMINQGDVLPISAAPISRVEPGEAITIDVLSSHFSRRRRDGISLHWTLSGMDSVGHLHSCMAAGYHRIPFRHQRVELARRIELTMPSETMLCNLSVSAVTPEGQVIASNFIQRFVEAPFSEFDVRAGVQIFRKRASAWSGAAWSGGCCAREEAAMKGFCYGKGSGFFEWEFGEEAVLAIHAAKRVSILLEASSRREDTPQTDSYRYASRLQLAVNGLTVLKTVLPDHPHDSRGCLSHLRGAYGAYGYLLMSAIENELLDLLVQRVDADGVLVVRTEVLGEPCGGLTVYDHDCGGYPICPSIVVRKGSNGL